MNLDLNKLEKIISIKFKNQKLLKQSLTHKSFNSIESNEKLEFLGDRVLGLVISKKLFEKYLLQPYLFHLERNSDELIRNTTVEVHHFSSALSQLLIFLTELLVIIGVGSEK